MLDVDPAIGQTRFHWLRSAPDAPGADNLVGLTERIAFLRSLGISARLQARISVGRWEQMVREGDAAPAWLAEDYGACRRRATIVVQIVKLGQKLTDDVVMMFIKLMGRLYSKANNQKKQRHMDARLETSKALRLFIDTIVALQAANDTYEDALATVNRQVGWHRLLQIKPGLEAMVEERQCFASRAGGQAAWEYPKVCRSLPSDVTLTRDADTIHFWRRSRLCKCFMRRGGVFCRIACLSAILGQTRKSSSSKTENRIVGFTRLQCSRICVTGYTGETCGLREVVRFDRLMKI